MYKNTFVCTLISDREYQDVVMEFDMIKESSELNHYIIYDSLFLRARNITKIM